MTTTSDRKGEPAATTGLGGSLATGIFVGLSTPLRRAG